MNKERMSSFIDKESGIGFSENINLEGYNFHKNNSFISFKIMKMENINIVNIKYFYSDSTEDFKAILAYACNFWMGMRVKLIYYREKEKSPYVVNTLRRLGFKIVDDKIAAKKYDHPFQCSKCGTSECKCRQIEAHL